MSVAAIIRPADSDLREWDARVDTAEDDGIRARWEYGMALARRRIGKKLPTGLLDEEVEKTGKSRQELQARMKFAEDYATPEALSNAIRQFGSWFAIVNRTTRESHAPVTAVSAPRGTFSTIVADPPWQYDNKATRGAAANHYPTMSIEELHALPVDDWSAPQAHLYLWTTNGFLREAFGVMEAWGFDYKTTLIWVKPQIGMGNYFRSSAEYVLFGVRGGLRTKDCNQPNWFNAPRQRHSQKPGYFFDLVEKASFAPYLEMFARQRRLGDEWSYWGNEA